MKNPLGFNRLGSTPTDTAPTQVPAPVDSTPAPASPETPQAPSTVHVHRRRRALVLAAIAVVAVLMYTNRTPAPVSTPGAITSASASSSLTPAMPTAQSEVLSLMAQAQNYYKAHESYAGFSPPLSPSAKVSPAGQGIVISDDLDGVCAYSGMLGITVNPVYIDPTGIACTKVSLGAPKAG